MLLPPSALAAVGKHPRVVSATREMLGLSLAVLLVFSFFVWRVVIGTDKRLSASKTTAAVWTYLIAGSFLGFVFAKLIGHPQALTKMTHSGLAGQYGLLIGGPIGAAIAAKGLAVGRNKPASTTRAKPSQLVKDDQGDVELGNLQYVLFNLVAMVYFVGTLMQHPTNGLPVIPDVLLGLTSVAALGYVGKKTLPEARRLVAGNREAGRHEPAKGTTGQHR